MIAWLRSLFARPDRIKPAHPPYDDVPGIHPTKPWPRHHPHDVPNRNPPPTYARPPAPPAPPPKMADCIRIVTGAPGEGMSFKPPRVDCDQWEREFDEFKRKAGVY